MGSKEGGAQVLLIGATNRIETIDVALRRAGRFDREICLGIPDVKAREQILRVLFRNLRLSPEFDYASLAKLTPGYVGADLQALMREAAVQAVDKVLTGQAMAMEASIPALSGVTNEAEGKEVYISSPVTQPMLTEHTGGAKKVQDEKTKQPEEVAHDAVPDEDKQSSANTNQIGRAHV